MKVLVFYRRFIAQYSISCAEAGVLHARLLRYDGSFNQLPPPNIRLMKTPQGWVGNKDDTHLVQHLGAQIEKNFAAGQELPKESEDPLTRFLRKEE